LAFKGDTSQIPLLSIFQTLTLNGQCGILSINSGRMKRKILFTESGVSLLLNYRGDPDPMRQILVKLKIVTDSQFQNVISTKNDEASPIGEFFVQRRVIDPDLVGSSIASHLLEHIFDTFSWKEAKYEFVAAAPYEGLEIFSPEPYGPEVTFQCQAVMMEVARREDEWVRIRQNITDSKEIYVAVNPQGFLDDAEYNSEVCDDSILEVKRLIDGENTLERISDQVTISQYETYQAIIQLKAGEEIRSLDDEELKGLAEKLRKKFKLREVIDIYHRLLARDPSDIRSRLKLITVLESKSQFNEELADQYEQLATHFLDEDEGELALDYLNRLLDIAPDSLFGLETLFDIQINSRQEKDAIITSRPLVEAAKRCGDYERATAILTKIVERFPEDTSFPHELADVHQYSGNTDQAVASLKHVSAIYESRNDLMRLRKTYERIAALDPSEQPKLRRIQERFKQNKRSLKSSILPMAALSLVLTFFFLIFYWLVLEVLCRQTYASAKSEVDTMVQQQRYTDATKTLQNIRESYPLTIFSLELGQQIQDLLRKRRDYDSKQREQADEHNLNFGSILAQVEALLGERKYLDALSRLRDVPKEYLSVGHRKTVDGIESDITNLFLESSSLLKRARTLTKAGKHADAHEIYVKLLRDFPNTPATQGLKTPMVIHSYPPGAEVFINGNHSGQSPLLVYFDPFAKLQINVKKRGFEEFNCSNYDSSPCFDFTRDWALTVRLVMVPEWVFDAKGSIESTPAFDEDRIFVATRQGKVFCVNAASGKSIWSYSTPSSWDVGNRLGQWKDRVFFGTFDGIFIALDKGSGKSLLKASPFSQSGTPQIFPSRATDRGIVAISDGRKVIGIRLDSGSVIWSYSNDGLLETAPLLSRDNFVCFTGGGEIVELDGRRGTVLRSMNVNATVRKPGTLFGDSVFVADTEGKVYRAQLDTGNILWTHSSATSDLTPPAVGNEFIVFGSEGGSVFALQLQDGKRAWKRDINDAQFMARGIVTRNKFISGTRGGQFYCLDVNSGRLYWKFQTDGPLLSPPAVKAGRLFIGSGKNTLYSFSF
jgi:outer membrane protein assembly factor BamB/tetratricopeptide (TPR) repeat protein